MEEVEGEKTNERSLSWELTGEGGKKEEKGKYLEISCHRVSSPFHLFSFSVSHILGVNLPIFSGISSASSACDVIPSNFLHKPQTSFTP